MNTRYLEVATSRFEFLRGVYDGASRVIRQYQGFDLDETLYSEALHVDGDTILEQTEMSYDAAGNLIQSATRQRYHNATGTGELGSPGSAQPKARVSYLAQWHDPLGRVIATADYGTHGGTALSRPSTIPASTDTVLVTASGYNRAGESHKTVDPAGREDRQQFDAAGRQVALIENYVDGDPDTRLSDEDISPAYIIRCFFACHTLNQCMCSHSFQRSIHSEVNNVGILPRRL